jgi:hypothetical protein
MVPVNLLKPPSCLPVTFEPVNDTLEFSGDITRLAPFTAGAAAVELFAAFEFAELVVFDAFDVFVVVAFGLFAAGSSHAVRKIVNDRIPKSNFDILIPLSSISSSSKDSLLSR